MCTLCVTTSSITFCVLWTKHRRRVLEMSLQQHEAVVRRMCGRHNSAEYSMCLVHYRAPSYYCQVRASFNTLKHVGSRTVQLLTYRKPSASKLQKKTLLDALGNKEIFFCL